MLYNIQFHAAFSIPSPYIANKKHTTMKTKHTPGPWYIDYNGFYSDNGPTIRSKVWEDIGQPIGETYFYEPDCPDDHKECEANAQLMAAAPEMIETLINIRQWYEENHQHYFGEDTPIVFSEALSIIQKTTI